MSHPTVQLRMPLTNNLKAMGSTGPFQSGTGRLEIHLKPSQNSVTGSPSTSKTSVEPNAFMNMLRDGVNAVNQAQHQADGQVHALLTGGDVTQAEVLTSVQKADMAFRLLVQVRNKLMSAYEELNSIRV